MLHVSSVVLEAERPQVGVSVYVSVFPLKSSLDSEFLNCFQWQSVVYYFLSAGFFVEFQVFLFF